MEAFGIIGMSMGSAGLAFGIIGMIAKTEVDKLRSEYEELKEELREAGVLKKT